MRKRPNLEFLVLILIFALIITSVGIYVLINSNNYIKCNKFILGDSMENNKVDSDYQLLLNEINSKYFEKVCDIFEDAKKQMLSQVDSLLGEEYTNLNEQIKELKERAYKIRQDFNDDAYFLELKEKLEIAKEEFVTADDESREQKKQALNQILAEVASRNLGILSSITEIGKQIEEKRNQAIDLVKQKESSIKKCEEEIVGKARQKTIELACSYKSESCALAYAFSVDKYPETMPFLAVFDPNMKLKDFNKEAFMAAYNNKNQECGKCSGDCLSCHSNGAESSANKNYFKSDLKDEFND